MPLCIMERNSSKITFQHFFGQKDEKYIFVDHQVCFGKAYREFQWLFHPFLIFYNVENRYSEFEYYFPNKSGIIDLNIVI